MGLMYLNQYGIESVFARSFNHTGPGQSPAYAVGSFASQIARLERDGGGEMYVGNLDSRRDFLDVRDVVRAYTMLLEQARPGEAYNVCSGVSVRMGDLLDRLLEVSGLRGRCRCTSRNCTRRQQRTFGSATPEGFEAVGWSPGIPLDRSLCETLDWYRADQEDGQMKKALITGVTGQDGSYLAELLLAKGLRGARRGPAVLVVQQRPAGRRVPGPARGGCPLFQALRRPVRLVLADQPGPGSPARRGLQPGGPEPRQGVVRHPRVHRRRHRPRRRPASWKQ